MDNVNKELKKIKKMINTGLFPADLLKSTIQEYINEYDPIIHIDRPSVRFHFPYSRYPEFMNEIICDNLDGPSELDVRKIESFYLEARQRLFGLKFSKGTEIYEELVAKKIIEKCFNLDDLRAIKSRGNRFAQWYFPNTTIFGWRTIIKDEEDHLRIPLLWEYLGELSSIRWGFLEKMFRSDIPVLYYE